MVLLVLRVLRMLLLLMLRRRLRWGCVCPEVHLGRLVAPSHVGLLLGGIMGWAVPGRMVSERVLRRRLLLLLWLLLLQRLLVLQRRHRRRLLLTP
jgi:hypothetical protein